MSSLDVDDVDETKTNFIDKLLDEMKSEFNKTINSDDNTSESVSADSPPSLLTKPESGELEKNNDNDDDLIVTPPKQIKMNNSAAMEEVSETDIPESSNDGDEKTISKTTNHNHKGFDKSQSDSESAAMKDEVIPSELNEEKPRIVLTFRTEKSKAIVTTSIGAGADQDNNGCEESGLGRRSLRRMKTNSAIEEKEKDNNKKASDSEPSLKRSARRRSKDCTETILQSAIARKEKSYNETSRPQRLTRRLKPTPKILANLEMCQKNAAMKNDKLIKTNKTLKSSPPQTTTTNERQCFSYDKLDKNTEQAIAESDMMEYEESGGAKLLIAEQPHKKKFKRKHNNKIHHKAGAGIKLNAKKCKAVVSSSEVTHETDSESSLSHHDEIEEETHEEKRVIQSEMSPRKSSTDDTDTIKPYRRSHRKSIRTQEVEEQTDNGDILEPLSGSMADEKLIPADPESSLVSEIELATIKKCLCQNISQIYVTASDSSPVYCTAIDSINSQIIGCNNIVKGELSMLRPSTRVPYIILCDVHKQRLLRHNCCPTCGLFCTKGRFTQCPAQHQYHRDCQAVLNDIGFCPHCALPSPAFDIDIKMHCKRPPVFLPIQKQHKQSAKMSFKTANISSSNKAANDLIKPICITPPLIPFNTFELENIMNSAENTENYDLNMLYDAVKAVDCEKVAAILGCGDMKLSDIIPDSDGLTILHVASQEGLISIVHMLLVAGAEHDVLDRDQNTPLMLAIQAFKNEVVRYLIKSGASITFKGTDGMSALHLAAKSGNLEACEYLLSSTPNQRVYINSIDDGGWTPLVWACEHGHVDVTRFLLKNNADPLLRDVEQNVALHWAAFSGSTLITEMLLNKGCEVNAVNAHGDSPLHVAARQDQYNCVLILLIRGADVNLINKSEESPLDCCVRKPGECYKAISLNVHFAPQRHQTILTNDISRGKEINPVQCINVIDNESKPTDFVYVTENCFTTDLNIDRKISTLQSCQCEDRCTSSECLCSNNSLRCWYDDEGRLAADFNYADPPLLFECNPACNCNAITCNNRVVQHGLTQRFQLFRTVAKGWAIRTLRLIPKGSYVCEYIGEIISDLDADQREDDSYLFDLDNRDGETYCIDARRYGNLARFINHSCDPNLIPVKIYIDHQDLRFPRIAFFSNRDIQADEELGFDYGEKFWIIKYKSFTCTCGYSMCRYSDKTIKTTLENYQKRLEEQDVFIQEIIH